jgi:GNAT superfamily N-acetyltransferase
MECITVRAAQPGDGEALMRIHAEVAQYHVDLGPRDLQLPIPAGSDEEPDAEVGAKDAPTLRLVAEAEGEVAGALVARLLPPEDGAKRRTAPHLEETRLRIEYIATAAAIRRRGVGTRLVEAAEAWGRSVGATIAETSTYHGSPLSVPFWEERMGYQEPSVNLRKPL